MFGAKVQIAAFEKCLDGEMIVLPFSMALPYQPKTSCVPHNNSKRQLQVPVHGELVLFNSTQIFECLGELQPQP